MVRHKDKQWPEAWIDGKPASHEDVEKLTQRLDNDIFHIGQSYEEEAAHQIQCTKCGGVEFNVGEADYFTAIRCVKCEWEICFHEG